LRGKKSLLELAKTKKIKKLIKLAQESINEDEKEFFV